jgi:SAM-dependent methyltransferase
MTSDAGHDASEPVAIDYFSSGNRLRGVATKVALRAREAMFADFMDRCRPREDERVIDIGVTPDRTLADSNFFERLYPFKGQVTATSIEDAAFLEDQYPGMRFVQTSGERLPFDDGTFDVAFCSAVLEHVGDRAAQRSFVNEVTRVAKRCYLTTPNRWFPIEVHTFLPLIHWLPQPWHQRLLRLARRPFWASTDNLNLLSEQELRRLFARPDRVTIERRRLLGFTSNLVACYDATG